MSLKKLLGIISVVIIVVFSMMLTTSYAWYAFDNASTVFEGLTNNDDIIVSYQKGEYINTSVAVPIKSADVDKYSEKNNFNIIVKDKSKDNEIAVTISLTEINIDGYLQNANFKIDLYYQSDLVSSTAGNSLSSATKALGTVVLDNDITNNFELRVYILDDGTDQSDLMNRTFQAKIQIDVVSRLKTSFNDYSNPDIYVSAITIDGEASDSLPTNGYYDMTASCTKGSNLTWEPLSKTITYNSGSYVNDNCSLTFTSSTDYPLLSEMEEGSYVKYVGTNGCDGRACEGQNANYVSDIRMGYCYSQTYQFHVNGWRIGYKKDGSVHLISAGAPECVNIYVGDHSVKTSSATWDTSYYYGSGYIFDETTGYYTLTGITNSALAWSSNYESIIANTPYTCKSTSATATCSEKMYEVTSTSTSTSVVYYTYNAYEQSNGAPVHLANLDNQALKYCNEKYAKGGVCDSSTAWAMDAIDFEKITGNVLSSGSCYLKWSDMSCGYANDLIDNGGQYWFATPYNSSSSYQLIEWNPYRRYVSNYAYSSYAYGIRPVIYLESSVVVTGGAGTYEDPYTIGFE